MRSARSIWSALVLTLSVFTAATVPAFAEQVHPVCAANVHECGKTPATIEPCCCGEPDDASNQGGPLESRVHLTAPLTTVVADLTFAVPSDVFHPVGSPYSGSSRAAPLDLPTLFASLLL